MLADNASFALFNGLAIVGAKHLGFKVTWISHAQGIPASRNSDVGQGVYRTIRGGEEQPSHKAEVAPPG